MSSLSCVSHAISTTKFARGQVKLPSASEVHCVSEVSPDGEVWQT